MASNSKYYPVHIIRNEILSFIFAMTSLSSTVNADIAAERTCWQKKACEQWTIKRHTKQLIVLLSAAQSAVHSQETWGCTSADWHVTDKGSTSYIPITLFYTYYALSHVQTQAPQRWQDLELNLNTHACSGFQDSKTQWCTTGGVESDPILCKCP